MSERLEYVEFTFCYKCNRFTVPTDTRIKRKFQVCQCTECGTVDKRRIESGKRMQRKWYAAWQGDSKKAKEIQAKALKVRIEDGYAVEVLSATHK